MLQIHFIAGVGDVFNQASLPDNKKGQIEDVLASPNDPLFILHHAMVDCILAEWMRLHPEAEYPVAPEVIRDGHRRDDFSRGFFPVYTNGDMFFQAEKFGYTCELENI